MKQKDLATRLARRAHISKAAAADRLDRAVHKILAQLKRGCPVLLPGLGALTPKKKKTGFQFKSTNTGERRRDAEKR